MLSIVIPSLPGSTDGVDTIIELMKVHSDSLVCLVKVNKPDDEERDQEWYSWLALFREKDTIGQFVGYVNHWGTRFGAGQRGTGVWGFAKMMSVKDDLECKFLDLNWNEFDKDLRKQLSNNGNMEAIYKGWNELIRFHVYPELFHILPGAEYGPNEEWQKKIEIN